MDQTIPVLIVGAGPTGLMMATELSRYQIPFRIIDKKPTPTETSNATWLQTLTIEIFKYIGIDDRFINQANPCKGINIYIDGKSIGNISFAYIDSIYKFILMLPQKETEKLLTEFQNISVERSVELVDIRQLKNTVIATVKHANGKIEEITSNYVVACDGSNSTVREKCNLHFPGEDLKEQFVVADASIDSYMAKDEIHVYFGQGEIFSAFPLEANRYRISANLHLEYPRKNYYKGEIIEMAQERARGAYYVKDVSWVSTFWIHGKVLKKMRAKLIFFAGDAAHLHSPAGGQGMNTGIQDIFNLAWKLALVINKKAKPTLLNTYQSERYPIVSEIVKKTNHFTQLAIEENDFVKKIYQFMRKLKQSKEKTCQKIGMELTQLGLHYDNSPIISYPSKQIKTYAPGQRAANVRLDDTQTLFSNFDNTKHNILLFTGRKINQKNAMKMLALKHKLDDRYAEVIKTHLISQKELDTTDLIHDVKNYIHLKYKVNTPAMYVIRPDNYICYYSNKLDFTALNKFLKKYLY